MKQIPNIRSSAAPRLRVRHTSDSGGRHSPALRLEIRNSNLAAQPVQTLYCTSSFVLLAPVQSPTLLPHFCSGTCRASRELRGHFTAPTINRARHTGVCRAQGDRCMRRETPQPMHRIVLPANPQNASGVTTHPHAQQALRAWPVLPRTTMQKSRLLRPVRRTSCDFCSPNPPPTRPPA